MYFLKNFFYAAACGVATLALAATASAQYSITGYVVNNAQASNASVAGLASAVASHSGTQSFTASGLNFSSFGNIGNTGNGSLDYTLGSFATSLGSASSTPTYTGTATATTALDQGGAGGVIYNMTGTAHFTNGESFTLAHDDGATLIVNGVTILSDPGPTSPTTTPFTYSGPTGNESFQFIYGECCGAPAVFETTLVPATATPEPTSIALLGIAMLGTGFVYRRRKAS